MTGSDFLDADQLSQVLATTRQDLFRMETLPSYDVPINGNDLQRWLAGEPEPTWENKQPWLDTLARWAQEGRPRRRVRVIHDPPTDYERYACDWGYRLNEQAGENIRVLDLAETHLPAELDQAPGDWWLIDGRDVVAMHYHLDGRFDGAEVLNPQDITQHRRAADAAWQHAQGVRPVVGNPPAAPPPIPSGSQDRQGAIRLTLPARRDELSTTLHNLRTDADLPQTEVARRAGVSQPTISRFETGAQMPTEAEVERLCDIYRAPARIRGLQTAIVSGLPQTPDYVRGIESRSFKRRDVNPIRRR